ncbi:uncharacterized protein LOC100876439 [Megachile rotundata]|uniref:uncharacterized protein LOC100876439 n=1 Tax=Megachile rotundata TaxID=143995 RepID=UPI000258ECD5|nr:PREDICTED: PRKR-interacting protein 1 homolog [Megachile rotundata]XP_012145917.1 PREDICTED: PRKR-interacting protein 1 homolog [Megachile rotundata]XP_012145918.1 PREDICTED: PRKR-interacting protein 1 homolog [Megachile rotundata]
MPKSKEKEEEKPVVAKTAVDLQRLKLQKLMKNPEKPVIIPERPKIKSTPTVPEFVRNVMGSSAGAGSGEFHVYRHLRRKEYARQKFIQEKGQKELLDEEYHRKLEENRRIAEEITAKKRAKRLKRRQRGKQKKRTKAENVEQHNINENSSSEEESSGEQEINDKNDNTCERISNNETSDKDNKLEDDETVKPILTDSKENQNENSRSEDKLHLQSDCSEENNSEVVCVNETSSETLDTSVNIPKNDNSNTEQTCTDSTDAVS